MRVEIWSDVVCPWCYLGKRRFESALARFEHASEVEVRWRSFELDPSAPLQRTGGAAEHLVEKYGMSVDQARLRLRQLDELAAAEGLRYNLAATRSGNTLAAHRLIHLAYDQDAEKAGLLKEALLRAYFIELQPIGDPEVLAAVAVEVGLDPEKVGQVLESDRFAAEVRSDEQTAAALGCTGVPFFLFDRTFAVAGAQKPDVFLAALQRAWERSHPVIETFGAEGSLCTDDSCAI